MDKSSKLGKQNNILASIFARFTSYIVRMKDITVLEVYNEIVLGYCSTTTKIMNLYA